MDGECGSRAHMCEAVGERAGPECSRQAPAHVELVVEKGAGAGWGDDIKGR